MLFWMLRWGVIRSSKWSCKWDSFWLFSVLRKSFSTPPRKFAPSSRSILPGSWWLLISARNTESFGDGISRGRMSDSFNSPLWSSNFRGVHPINWSRSVSEWLTDWMNELMNEMMSEWMNELMNEIVMEGEQTEEASPMHSFILRTEARNNRARCFSDLEC